MKTHIGFGLYDILVKGKLDKKPDTSFMSELVEYSKENKKELFLISGLDKEIGEKIVKEHGIDSYFSKDKIYHIDENYYNTLTDIDKELKEQGKLKEHNYCDEYYKVYFFNNLFKGKQENCLFVGHDIWTDAYYISKYTKADVVLLKGTLTNNSAPSIMEIKDVRIIDSNFQEIKEYLEKETQFNYAPLHKYADKLLYQEMIGGSLFNTKQKVGSVWNRKKDKKSFEEGEEE
jgi:hypothetical protein